MFSRLTFILALFLVGAVGTGVMYHRMVVSGYEQEITALQANNLELKNQNAIVIAENKDLGAALTLQEEAVKKLMDANEALSTKADEAMNAFEKKSKEWETTFNNELKDLPTPSPDSCQEFQELLLQYVRVLEEIGQ